MSRYRKAREGYEPRSGWRERGAEPSRPDFRGLHAAVARVRHAPGSAVKAAVCLAERQRRYPKYRKIIVGYGARGPKPGIAEEAGMSRSSAIRGVRWLEEKGFLYRLPNKGGRGRANEYPPGPTLGAPKPAEPGPWDEPEYDPHTYRQRMTQQRDKLRAAAQALAARPPPSPLRSS